ncbi:hypothetical protein [Paenibacillus sp. LC231]|nr:hypothetical protein [Paenibacillus sp. LC231]
MTKKDYLRMKAALINILEISTDEFAKSQARYGLNIQVDVTEGEK